MAEGLLRHLAGDRYEVYSAGTHPVGLNPGAVAAMRELDVDISTQRSKSIDEFADKAFDYVITLCDRAKNSCPRWPHRGCLVHWSFEDPAAVMTSLEEQSKAFRAVRDRIKTRLEEFIDDEWMAHDRRTE
jgi:arsenate reductase